MIEQVPDSVVFHKKDICSKSIYPIFDDALVTNSSGEIVAYTINHEVPLGDMPWWDIVIEKGVCR